MLHPFILKECGGRRGLLLPRSMHSKNWGFVLMSFGCSLLGSFMRWLRGIDSAHVSGWNEKPDGCVSLPTRRNKDGARRFVLKT